MFMTLVDMDRVIDKVGSKLPAGFPEKVVTPIFDGMKSAKDRMD